MTSSRADYSNVSRSERFSLLQQDKKFDVVVIGGGIHGATVAKFLAELGVSIALFEQNDYASGTSSRSSKLAHGGLRYLEMFDFEQVFEGIKAREQLFAEVAHLVRPQDFLIPIKKSAYFQRLKLKIGLTLYDWMVTNSNRKHSFLASSMQQAQVLQLCGSSSNYTGAFRYYDGIMNDSRLVIDLIVRASQLGALTFNHTKVEKLSYDSSTKKWGVEVADALTKKSFSCSAKVVINCSGPWTSVIDQLAGIADHPHLIFSRGTHLLFSTPWPYPALFLPLPEKGRYYFVLPHPGGTLVGTTERGVENIENNPQPSKSECDEILERLERDLPLANLNRKTAYYAFAGLRALPLRGTGRGKTSTLSRKHIWSRKNQMLSLYGGKYTTFIWTAAEGVKAAMWMLDRGEVSESIFSIADLSKLRPAEGHHASLKEQVMRAFTLEQGCTIDDLMRRRLDLELMPGNGLGELEQIARMIAESSSEFGGIRGELLAEVEDYRERVRRFADLI